MSFQNQFGRDRFAAVEKGNYRGEHCLAPRIHVVINPGSGKPKPILHTLNAVFRRPDFEWEISLTRKNVAKLLHISSFETARYRDFYPTELGSPPEGWQPPYLYHWEDVSFVWVNV